MLTITNKQLKALSDCMLSTFFKKTIIHLRKKFPVSTRNVTDETLSSIIKDGVNKAGVYNIIELDDVLPFIEYMISLGSDFDVNPTYFWASKILKIHNLDGTEKIARLLEINPIYSETDYV